MTKFPIGLQSFEIMREEGYLYIDKTDLVYDLVHSLRYVFLSRPRRFGKSLLLSTIDNYYKGRRELFKGLKIDSMEHDWNVHPVFHLDFNGGRYDSHGSLKDVLEQNVAYWESTYGITPRGTELGQRFAMVLKVAHEQSGRRCVVLVDEYDKPLLDVLETGYTFNDNGQDRLVEDDNRSELKAFYSTFKAASNDLQFVMLTGITQFAQLSVFSGFNQITDISMSPRYEAICGITNDEIDTLLQQPIQALADAQGYSYSEAREQLRLMYDGYHFSRAMKDIYNPFSLIKALFEQEINYWWYKTGTTTYLMRLLLKTSTNYLDFVGKYYSASEFLNYRADKERPLPMIYQSGYLTIKDYNRDDDEYLLDYPNQEVRRGFTIDLGNAIFSGKDKDSNIWVRDVYRKLKVGDVEFFHQQLTSYLADIPYSMALGKGQRQREKFFQLVVYVLISQMKEFTVRGEKQSACGRADTIVETEKYVYIFEYKVDKPASEAIAQIREKGYAKPYATDGRQVVLIGCTFSSTTGTVADWATQAL